VMLASNLIKNRILIIGSNGMLGQRLAYHFMKMNNVELLCSSAEDDSFIPNVPYQKIDITGKLGVKELIMNFFPDYVINCAAFTNVDKSESERETAWRINVTGVENISFYCWTIDAHLIHFSTDYIFDGKNGPYSEEDKPNPIGYYGRTKLASENSVRISGTRNTIIRTNILYGPAKHGRPDYVKWVINSLRAGNEIRIVTDQIGNPTYIDDIVKSIESIIDFRIEGIFNIGGSEQITRYNFTIRIADFFNLNKTNIKPIVTSELNQPAPRPLKSGLIIEKARRILNYQPVTIEESFRMMQKELKL
jgi:dTDP-4-dehydrorhamnose reductase